MPSLRDDVFHRRGAEPAPEPALGPGFFVLVFLSVAALTLSRLGSDVVARVEGELVSAVTPALAAAGSAVEPARALVAQLTRVHELEAEARRLRAENDRLRLDGWRMAELEHKLAELERLQRVVADPPTAVVVARAVSPGNGLFTRAALLNAGRNHGVRNGHAVVTAQGLVGRVVASTGTAARVLLLSDPASRIPVRVGRGEARAILIGDGGPHPRLAFLAASPTIRPGDEIVTMSAGGLMTRGVRVGAVAIMDGEARAQLYVDRDRIDHVSILVHNAPALDLVDDDAGGERGARIARRDGRASGGR